MDKVRYSELIKMIKSGYKCRVRVKDIDDIASVCIHIEHPDGKYKDAETGVLFNQDMIDMCGKVFDITRGRVDDKRIYIRYNGYAWYFLPQWIDEVNQFDDDVIEMCDEVLI